jgi:precorrin-6Y C5,15-methyltransferase (decarboxylating)
LLILSEDGRTPAAVARLLSARGYGPSRLVVLEHMAGPRERRIEGTAASWTAEAIADLNTIAVTCLAEPGTPRLARVPGLPDEAFRHDGQLTKREVRAATLAALAPAPGECLWDVGAGCGSIAIEWARSHRMCRAMAIERQPARLALAAANAEALGCPTLGLVAGEAPAALADLPRPDAVFVGGGASQKGVIEACWAALPAGGRLVANVVTLEGEAALLAFHRDFGGSLTRLSVARAEPVGQFSGWRSLTPVTQLAAVKP